VLGAVVVLAGAALILTVRRALDGADVAEAAPASAARSADEEGVRQIPGLPEEAILAEDALARDDGLSA
jgi:hypothetical protein